MKEGHKKFLLLYLIPHLGSFKIATLLSFFKNIDQIFRASISDFVHLGFSKNFSEYLFTALRKTDISDYVNVLFENNIKMIDCTEVLYPKLLKKTSGYPPLLFYKGNITICNQPCISVIGTRTCSSYGIDTTTQFATDLCNNNITIVSGMALGIDSIAHSISIKNNKPTIAVLPSSLVQNEIYPRQHYNLSKKILEAGGCLISENLPGSHLQKYQFILRNRIIAGISPATLVIEAGEKSGTLTTAQYALDFGRDVMAIPGNISQSKSIGTNKLIQNGAHLITHYNDIADILSFSHLPQLPSQFLSPLEKEVITELSVTPMHCNQLAHKLQKTVTQLTPILTEMEIADKIKSHGGGFYSTIITI